MVPRLPCRETTRFGMVHGMPRDHPDLSDLVAVTDCRAARRASHREGRDRLEKVRCVLFWPPFFWSSSVLPLPTPQRCIIPNRGRSSSVPSEMSIRAFRRSCRTRPPATTIHPSLAAADLKAHPPLAKADNRQYVGAIDAPVLRTWWCAKPQVRAALIFCPGRRKELLWPIQFHELLSVDQPEPVAHRSHEVAVM